MARHKLSSPDQALPIRLLLLLYEALASMYLAVVLLISLALVLAWATFVERDYGTEAVHFAIYDAWWFAALLGLLGVNVLCAALIRFPWRRYQTGFVITHAGILVLLVGCIYSASGGIDAQMPILEGGIGRVAYEKTRHFQIKIYPDHSDDGTFSVIDVPFASGPFNWEDYERLSEPYWHAGYRDRGVICDQNGIRLEVLDFYRQWIHTSTRPLRIRAAVADEETGKLGVWESLDLSFEKMQQAGLMTAGVQDRLDSGVRFIFSVATSRAETEAFRMAGPKGELGEAGQLVLFARGQVFRYQVDDLEEGQRLKLGNTGYEAEFMGQSPAFLGIDLRIHPPHESPERMRLLAEMPEFNTQVDDHGIFGSYWVDIASPVMAEATTLLCDPNEPRIDLIQSVDGSLLYRVWQSPVLQEASELPIRRETELTLGTAKRPIRFYVDKSFRPHDYPGMHLEPERFDKDMAQRSLPLVRVRLTVDGHSDEFWLLQWQPPLFEQPDNPLQKRVVVGDGRRVELMLCPDSVDVGLNIYLDKFQRKLDPGSSSMVSHYSSVVDFVKANPEADKESTNKVLEENVLITLNEPITRVDPATGRSFRIYQEGFDGPWKPGVPDPRWAPLCPYDEHLGGKVLRGEEMPRDELYQSTLTVNYDPGRGLKYFGCLMIVAGIATIFYMKAYFFARRPKGGEAETGTA